MIGNSVVPQVAEWIGRRILASFIDRSEVSSNELIDSI